MDAIEGRGADLDPPGDGGLVVERRRSVRDPVEHVEAVGELVVHDVLTLFGPARAASGRRPGEHHGSLVARLAREALGPRRPGPAAGRSRSGQAHGRAVDDDRRHVGVLVELESEQQHRGLRRDEDLHVIGEIHALGGLPTTTVEEAADQHPHPVEFGVGQSAPVIEVGDQHLLPRRLEDRWVGGQEVAEAIEHRSGTGRLRPARRRPSESTVTVEVRP